jgi:hypothetical protein
VEYSCDNLLDVTKKEPGAAVEERIIPHIVIIHHLCAPNDLSILHACYVIEVCII